MRIVFIVDGIKCEDRAKINFDNSFESLGIP